MHHLILDMKQDTLHQYRKKDRTTLVFYKIKIEIEIDIEIKIKIEIKIEIDLPAAV